MTKKIVFAIGSIGAILGIGLISYQAFTGNFLIAGATGTTTTSTTCVPNPEADLSGSFTGGGGARVTNASANCTYNVGLASYKMFDSNIDNQVLFDSETRTIAPGQTLTLAVDIPSCSYQIDLFYGNLIISFKGGVRYGDRLIVGRQITTTYCSSLPQIPAPTVSVACNALVGQPEVDVSWSEAGRGSEGYKVEFTPNNDFSTGGWYKSVSASTTELNDISNFNGFTAFGNTPGNLTMGAGKTFKVRIYYKKTGSYSPIVSITTPSNCPPPPATFNGSCVASKTTAAINEEITWSAQATGGIAPYTYSWTGDDNLSGTTTSVKKAYATSGTKNATVAITSGSTTIARQCSLAITQPTSSAFDGTCSVNKSVVDTNEAVVWSAQGTGGSGTYTYAWSGDITATTSQTVTTSYSSGGTRTASVAITSGSSTVTRQCSVNVSIPGGGGTVFDAFCSVSPSSGYTGDTITWSASGTGGNSLYTYVWSGTDGLSASSTSSSVSKIYSTDGRKEATVTVYSGTMSATKTCSIYISPRGGGGGGGSGGGGGGGTITREFGPSLPGGVYLSQIPYTGIGSNAKVGIFMLGLLGWSGIISYLLIRRRAAKHGLTVAELFGSIDQAPAALAAIVADKEAVDSRLESLKQHKAKRTIPIIEGIEHDITLTPYEPKIQSPVESPFMKQPAVKAPEQEIQIQKPQAQIALPSKKEDVVDSLEMRARELRTLVSADGLEIIAQAAENNKHNALIILNHLIELYKGTEHEVEGDWMVLNGEKINKILFSTYITMTPVFIRWIVDGDDRKTLAFVRMLQMQGQSVGDFITNIALELDKVYRYRMENHGDADTQILDHTMPWSDHELEAVIHTLVSAVDQTYKSVYPSVKIALIRILDMSKAKSTS